MQKYKPGDVVKVKTNICSLRCDEDPGYSQNMISYEGQELVVKGPSEYNIDKWYKLEGNDWIWHEAWLEPVTKYEITETEFMGLFE